MVDRQQWWKPRAEGANGKNGVSDKWPVVAPEKVKVNNIRQGSVHITLGPEERFLMTRDSLNNLSGPETTRVFSRVLVGELVGQEWGDFLFSEGVIYVCSMIRQESWWPWPFLGDHLQNKT